MTGKKLLRWIPALIVMAIIFYLSSRHGTLLAPTQLTNHLANKGAHLFWFMLLCLTFFRATKSEFTAVSLTTLYAVTDEFHQTFVPTRTGQVTDILIDFVGACLVGLILWKSYPSLPKILKNWLEA